MFSLPTPPFCTESPKSVTWDGQGEVSVKLLRKHLKSTKKQAQNKHYITYLHKLKECLSNLILSPDSDVVETFK